MDRDNYEIGEPVRCFDRCDHGVDRIPVSHSGSRRSGEPAFMRKDTTEPDHSYSPTVHFEQSGLSGLGLVGAGPDRIQPDVFEKATALEHGALAVVLSVIVAEVGDIDPRFDGCGIRLGVTAEDKLLWFRRPVGRRRALQVDDRQVVVDEKAAKARPCMIVSAAPQGPDDIAV
jgi:hypothetical protein